MIMNKQVSGGGEHEQAPAEAGKRAAELCRFGDQSSSSSSQPAGVLRAPSRPASSLGQAPEAEQATINNRSHRPEPKLSVVIPDNQKSLLTPTIVTTSEAGPFSGPQLCNGLAAAATPIQLFSSLVQDHGLFTGVPSCTPTSADGLAVTSNINAINPFFYGVSGFNTQATFQQEAGEAGVCAVAPASRQTEPDAANPEVNSTTGGPPEQKPALPVSNQQLGKLSLDQLHANVMMLSPLFLPISPEHDAWLRQFNLANHHNNHHPLGVQQQQHQHVDYGQTMNAVAYQHQQQQQQQEQFQQQIAAARAAQDLTNQPGATGNGYPSFNSNGAGNCLAQQQQQQSFYMPRGGQQFGGQPPPAQAPPPAASVRPPFASSTEPAKRPQQISSPFANQQAACHNQPAPAARLAHFGSGQQQTAGSCKQTTDPNNNNSHQAAQLSQLLHQQPPAAHNQTSVIQTTLDCNNLNARQLYQPPPTFGARRPEPEVAAVVETSSSVVVPGELPARDYASSNSSSSSSSTSSLEQSSSCLNNSPEGRSSISRDTINVDLSNSARTLTSLGETTLLAERTASQLARDTTARRNKKMIESQSRTGSGVSSAAVLENNQFGAELVPKKKSKGGRKKKLITAEEMVARKNRSKERNRVAAKRCRQKRKQFLDELRDRIDNLNDLNRKLQKENTMLKSELDSLKQRHKSCRI